LCSNCLFFATHSVRIGVNKSAFDLVHLIPRKALITSRSGWLSRCTGVDSRSRPNLRLVWKSCLFSVASSLWRLLGRLECPCRPLPGPQSDSEVKSDKSEDVPASCGLGHGGSSVSNGTPLPFRPKKWYPSLPFRENLLLSKKSTKICKNH
jgi:hypothetical protein